MTVTSNSAEGFYLGNYVTEPLGPMMKNYVGADPRGAEIMEKKLRTVAILVDGLSWREALILKEELLSVGGDGAVPRDVLLPVDGHHKVLGFAPFSGWRQVAKKLEGQPFKGTKRCAEILALTLDNLEKEKKWVVKGKDLLKNKRWVVMGILNVTPDSFSDGGKYNDPKRALERALQMLEEGADLVDVGGESTRPGSERVSAAEELRRVIPVILGIKEEKPNSVVSVDTYKAEVAREAVEAGASVVNDISGGKDPEMFEFVNSSDVGYVLNHMKGNDPKTMQKDPHYEDVLLEVRDYFLHRLARLKKAAKEDRIVLDIGVGFGKRLTDNLQLIKKCSWFETSGFPTMIGASRKSFLKLLGCGENPLERESGSLAAIVFPFLNGTKVVRVHNVKETVKFLKTLSSLEEGYIWRI